MTQAPIRTGPIVAGLAAALSAAGLWLVLSVFTRQIFHLMPATPFLAAGLVFRAVAANPKDSSSTRSAGFSEALVLMVATALIAVGGAAAVRQAGGFLDAPAAVVAIAAGGALAATIWIRLR